MIEEQLSAILAEIAELDTSRARLERRADVFRGAIQSLEAVIGVEGAHEATSQEAPSYAARLRLIVPPRTTGERLLVLMQSESGRIWTLNELLEKMRERGWISPTIRHQRETLRLAINTLARNNPTVERLTPTSYRFSGRVPTAAGTR